MKTIGQQGVVLLWCALCWHLLHQGALANNFTKVTIFIIIFYYNYYKSCYLGKIVSNIFGNCTVDFGMEVWQMACLSNSTHSCLVLSKDPTNLLFSCLCQRKHQYHFANHVIRSFVRRLPFLRKKWLPFVSSQPLFWLQKTLTSHL